MSHTLKGKLALITGSSRGIGREIALRLAKEGANVVILAKTAEENPKLPGTIFSVAEEISALGVRALPLQVDVRDEAQVYAAVEESINQFGQIDILVNNASAIGLTPTLKTPMKKYDLLMDVNVRATYLCSQACIPHLEKSLNPHILNLAPPLNMKPKWFGNHVAYTISKYGMSMCTLGMAQELKSSKIAVNSLWPKTIIATSAISNNFPPELLKGCRKPAIVADAAYEILISDSTDFSGNFVIDEDLLRSKNYIDFENYAEYPGHALIPDYFLD